VGPQESPASNKEAGLLFILAFFLKKFRVEILFSKIANPLLTDKMLIRQEAKAK